MPTDPGRRARSFIHLQRVADPLRLRLLVEVGARGSISAAAEACSIGQPSASLHLRHLEAAVGYTLVDRGTTGSRLTPEGEVVLLHATRMLAALEAMLDELSAQHEGTRGRLAIAASTAASYLVPPALRRFGELHPHVDVSVMVDNSAGVHSRVRRREVMLGIAGPVPASSGLETEHLLDDEVVGIAAPGLLEPAAAVVAPEELAQQTLLVRQPGSGQQLAAGGVFEQHLEGHVRKTWVLDSEEAVKRSVRERLGIGFVSKLAIRDEVARGEVVTFRLAGVGPINHPLHIARPVDGRSTVVQRSFINALCDAWLALGGGRRTASARFTNAASREPSRPAAARDIRAR
jgi:DNA-binding transcriptional LysR family regulator